MDEWELLGKKVVEAYFMERKQPGWEAGSAMVWELSVLAYGWSLEGKGKVKSEWEEGDSKGKSAMKLERSWELS